MAASSSDQSFDDYLTELAQRDVPPHAHEIQSLRDDGPERYLLKRAQYAQMANPAPALISFGYVIATENQQAHVSPDAIIELIRKDYGDEAEEIIEEFEDALGEISR